MHQAVTVTTVGSRICSLAPAFNGAIHHCLKRWSVNNRMKVHSHGIASAPSGIKRRNESLVVHYVLRFWTFSYSGRKFPQSCCLMTKTWNPCCAGHSLPPGFVPLKASRKFRTINTARLRRAFTVS